MFKTTIVVWLVLLVLPLTVVAFVTRIIEECRSPRDLSNPQKEPHKPVSRWYWNVDRASRHTGRNCLLCAIGYCGIYEQDLW